MTTFATAHAAKLHISNSDRAGQKLTSIYGLFHLGRCVYVGRTRSPHQRMIRHTGWIYAKLKAIPAKKILEIVQASEGCAAERKWIEFYSARGEADLNRKLRPNPPISGQQFYISPTKKDRASHRRSNKKTTTANGVQSARGQESRVNHDDE